MGTSHFRAEDLGSLALGVRPGGIRLNVLAKPRASRTAIAGVREGALEVRVAAPPVDGEANAELVRALSKWLEVPARNVVVVSGEAAKHKIIEVSGLDASALRDRLARR